MAGRGGGAGRPGSLDEARELVALVTSLSDAGDALGADAVAERLGVSEERAEKLLELVLSSASAGGAGLPLAEDGDLLTLVGADGVRGRRLRLSHAETLALDAALERLGVPGDDPLRETLSGALAAEPVDEGLVRRLMAGERGEKGLARTLVACGRAIAGRRVLEFAYRKPDGGTTERRRVVPRELRSEDGAWFLDAHDLDRNAERTFRADRMSEVETGRRAPDGPTEPERPRARTVRLTFEDAALLDLLPWHDLHVTSAPGARPVVAETPYYGGMWLPRMLAACGGSARCDDPEVTSLATSYAQQQLEEA
ncbi:WYL domain-containing protein [Olsenella uli]|uniref:helix-turn-helix transcriptional regulator n=1 Tax=Olsenella uli TaxID=133926 RepID=UPI001958BC26|nr:WYL domain-containing protein [Olsenella uli]MBM6676009.1 WYL domain-containing protein [Olsenella uli]